VIEASKVHQDLLDRPQVCVALMPLAKASPAKRTKRLSPQFAREGLVVRFCRMERFVVPVPAELLAFACVNKDSFQPNDRMTAEENPGR
jgi:hypothetical protein